LSVTCVQLGSIAKPIALDLRAQQLEVARVRLHGVHAPRGAYEASHHDREVADVRADIERGHSGFQRLLDDEFLLDLAAAEMDELAADARIVPVEDQPKIVDRPLHITT